MTHRLIVVFLTLVFGSFIQAHEITCRGGDGPTPFINVSDKLPTAAFPIKTVGAVSEFIHWPSHEAIVYRNEFNQLRKRYRKSNKDVYISDLAAALSPLVDSSERYVLTNKANWYLNTEEGSPGWGQFQSIGPVTHLFWHQGFLGRTYLYSMENVGAGFAIENQNLNILRFTAGATKPEKCQLVTALGEVFHLGNGHRYPYAFLYKIYETAAGSYLSLYRIRVDSGSNSCGLEPIKTYPNPIPGEIQSVHQFADENAFAVVTHLASTKKVFWDSPKTPGVLCDFGQREPVILNEQNPVVAGWEADSGLTLLFPDARTYANILPEKTKGLLRKKDINLTDDGRTLLLNLKKQNGYRELSAYRFE